MFAFALWDRNRRDAVPRARPPRRQAAVLRAAADGTLLFGSELKSLLAHGGLAARPRSARGRGVLRARLRARAAHDLRRGAASCRPAHTLVVRRGQPLPRAARVLGRALHAATTRLGEADACDELVRAPARVGAPAHDLRGAARRLPVRRRRLQRRRRDDGRRSRASRSTPARSPSTTRRYDESALRAAGRRPLRHAPLRRPRRERRLRPDRQAGAAVRRAVRRQLGDPDLPRLPAGAPARHRRAVGRRRRRELRRLPPLSAAPDARSGCARRCRSALRRPRVRRCSARSIRRPTGRRASCAPRRPSRRSRATRSRPTSTACRSCATTCAAQLFSHGFKRAARRLPRARGVPAPRRHAPSTDDPLALDPVPRPARPTWSATSTPRSTARAWRTRSRCASR